MPLIECTHGPAQPQVAGTFYEFQRDEHGRFVCDVGNMEHVMVLTSVVHFRLAEAVPAKPAKTASPTDPNSGGPITTDAGGEAPQDQSAAEANTGDGDEAEQAATEEVSDGGGNGDTGAWGSNATDAGEQRPDEKAAEAPKKPRSRRTKNADDGNATDANHGETPTTA